MERAKGRSVEKEHGKEEERSRTNVLGYFFHGRLLVVLVVTQKRVVHLHIALNTLSKTKEIHQLTWLSSRRKQCVKVDGRGKREGGRGKRN